MAEYICEGPCGESKDIITGFYAANNKRGRDGTCIACRLLQANQRLSRRRLERDSANGYIKKGYPEAKYKPSPENFRAAGIRFGLEQVEILHVAQSIHHDIIPGNKLGWKNVWVNRYAEPERTDPREFPDLEVPDLASLVRILDIESNFSA